jgi:hypothetical protein
VIIVRLDARSVLFDEEGEIEEILDGLPEIVRIDDEFKEVHAGASADIF